MALLLKFLGARVTGLSLDPVTQPSIYEVLSPWQNLTSLRCDMRDREALSRAVEEARPEIVIHMAAQSLVRESYRDPLGTIGTNVLGTIHLLEVLRQVPDLAAVLVVTSDKVYQNREAGVAFAKSAPLGGRDPYSASKAAAEILTGAYARSFYDGRGIPVCTARAGNVIGGGDWAHDRLIPDLWRALASGRTGSPSQSRRSTAVAACLGSTPRLPRISPALPRCACNDTANAQFRTPERAAAHGAPDRALLRGRHGYR